jgi:hypothetical protein
MLENESVVDSINFVETVKKLIYQSHNEYMIGAFATMPFSILCVLPFYSGFWRLGRKVTLGPIEIAWTLGAPVLQEPHGSTGGDVNNLLKEVGGREIRYGT